MEENSNISENCKSSVETKLSFSTLTNREWIARIVQMKMNEENFNTPLNSNGWTLLMYATKYADWKIMKQILNLKNSKGNQCININAQDKKGNRALVIAVKLNDDNKIKLLIQNDADMDLAKKNSSKRECVKLEKI